MMILYLFQICSQPMLNIYQEQARFQQHHLIGLKLHINQQQEQSLEKGIFAMNQLI